MRCLDQGLSRAIERAKHFTYLLFGVQNPVHAHRDGRFRRGQVHHGILTIALEPTMSGRSMRTNAVHTDFFGFGIVFELCPTNVYFVRSRRRIAPAESAPKLKLVRSPQLLSLARLSFPAHCSAIGIRIKVISTLHDVSP